MQKQYSINQSPFFKLQSRRKLASLFGNSLAELNSIASRNDNYRVFLIGKGTPKERLVEVPKPILERIHRRIFSLVRRISQPEYLFSGVKGRSYIGHAAMHKGGSRLVTLDIEKFYPSTRGWHVFEFFNKQMHCSKDVSGLLTTLCTYNDHVPTGSCISQQIAFFAHYAMFEEISRVAREANLTFSCYVDDLAFSGEKANASMLYRLRGILAKRGLRSKPNKEHLFNIGQARHVTGTIVTSSGLFLPNKKHKAFHDAIKEFSRMPDDAVKLDFLVREVGRAIAATQISKTNQPRERMLVAEKNRVENVVHNS